MDAGGRATQEQLPRTQMTQIVMINADFPWSYPRFIIIICVICVLYVFGGYFLLVTLTLNTAVTCPVRRTIPAKTKNK